MKRNMRHKEDLDLESAKSLLQKALKLANYNDKDFYELQAEFDERFGTGRPIDERNGGEYDNSDR
jgi:hypothetical protein